MQKVGLFWFNHDLRIDDNATLLRAAAEVDTLICLYCADTAKTGPGSRQPAELSLRRREFLFESLQDLEAQLNRHGQKLVVRIQPPLEAIAQLITVHNVSHIYRSNHVGSYENTIWTILRKRYGMLTFTQCHTHTLFEPSQLPFAIDQLPSSFSKFRRVVEKMDINSGIAEPLPTPTSLPKPALVADLAWQKRWHEYFTQSSDSPALFRGGASAGRRHLENYFGSRRASDYKATRNGLDGMDYSTKFSPWLANGSLSTRHIVRQLQGYEERAGANDSTYWILFELLWREYFQWYGHKYQQRLFTFSGIGNSTPITSFYPERFKKWCVGNTPYAIINACMRQLNATGYLSNRGRQLAASCFVHELGLDWRHGATYFEQQLVDYDVASNWGNWQYLAGVGADPRGHRHFDLQKQAQIYDPDNHFVHRWAGEDSLQPLDSVDAADWPI
ncbi:Deoxyribodipyrimidine photolyase [marine gamma proteobacterium HTCC2143]|uniref:Cryptochrome DASH n=1 Tax=marine gamma proteobacterium HTCC2143 TaxID=247633 RepID=A0YCX3_9GAMM|nr:Deoxyribodipyrimidine photolyase [marine gamma proteobacterium HTCC2143]